VLIVEDEPEVAQILEFNLQAAGFETRTALDGLTACRLVGERPPNLILLDVLLPDLLGWEICRMIRGHNDPAVAQIPIVMLTALTTTEDRVRGLELGADDYLSKPFSVREVILRVRNLIDKRRSAESTARRLWDLERDRQADRDLQSLLFHELRNKLLVIGGFSNRLAAGVADGERSRGYADVIHQTAEYLSSLAEQVLLLRQVENRGLELPVEEVHLGELARNVAALHRGGAEEKGIRLSVEGATLGATARANPLALRVCLSNLVENAIRYSPPETGVVVRSGAGGGQAHLEVDDEGPGVPEDERDRVFDRFFRGANSHGVTGTGLGLYVVRTLARAMGGEAALGSGPDGRGTRARIDVPGGDAHRTLAKPSESEAGCVAARPATRPRPRSPAVAADG
jgi:signal transduction histidine kinase